jgi:hypothetical protein
LLVDKSWPFRLRKALYLFKLLEEASKALTAEDIAFLEKAVATEEETAEE